MTGPDPIALTRQWLERAVIGLNLCPFAKAVYVKHQVRMVATDASSTDQLLGELDGELAFLRDADPQRTDTTLLIHPGVLNDFLEYNDFLGHADAAVAAAGLRGVIQIASFHPGYRFAGTAADDVGNCTNRSPFPMLHLLREDSVARAVAAFPDADAIVQRNLATLAALGHEGWARLFASDA